eukprot:GHVT01065511.1.p2 GENE.GHVT01065511.1~~GHVT01065511.1.p2  ORF type:complete len:193 (-),score=37.00 GHVT01065511.1:6866-7444(-)
MRISACVYGRWAWRTSNPDAKPVTSAGAVDVAGPSTSYTHQELPKLISGSPMSRPSSSSSSSSSSPSPDRSAGGDISVGSGLVSRSSSPLSSLELGLSKNFVDMLAAGALNTMVGGFEHSMQGPIMPPGLRVNGGGTAVSLPPPPGAEAQQEQKEESTSVVLFGGLLGVIVFCILGCVVAAICKGRKKKGRR